MIILGIVLLCVGLLVPKLAILFTIGIILLIVGLLLLALGQLGHPVGGRTWY
jgi:membrane-bound ClpP family serine protease